jgi:hypothetical protein
MATIRKIIDVIAPAAQVWDIIRDVGAVHTRFVPGFVIDTTLEDGARVVKFANGMTVRELIVGVDDELRRLAYAATGGISQHHNASFEVVELSAERTRIVWTTDVLPESAAKIVGQMIEAGSAAIAQSLNGLGR